MDKFIMGLGYKSSEEFYYRVILGGVVLLIVCLCGVFWGRGGGRGVALVNGVRISQKEFDRYVDNYKYGIVQSLVMDELLRQKAEELGVKVTGKEVKGEVDRIKEGLGDGESFGEYLKDRGLSENGLKYNIEMMLMRDKVLDEVKKEVEVTENDILEAYEVDKDYYVNIDVYYIITGDADKALEMQKELTFTDSFKDIKEKYKDSIMSEGRLDYVTKGDSVIGDRVESVKKGDVLVMDRDDLGAFMVVKVVEKRESLEDLRGYIRDRLAESVKYERFNQMMDEFTDKAKIDYLEF